MSTQTIFTDLQSGDNKKLWAYAQELNAFRRKDKEVADSSTIDFNDKSAVKQYISEALLRQMDNGNAASAKELARILGVNEETQDLILEPVNFAEATWEIE